jgi:3-phosphoshikimate 1-carboxyvinyltransferase
MIPVTMALKDEAIFMGSGRLPHRPLSPLDTEMEKHGCRFQMAEASSEDLQEICRISGRLQAGNFYIPGNISSQYITGLLFALPLLDGDSSIRITSPLESGKYVDMTLDVLKQFGIIIDTEHNDGCPVYKIKGNQKYRAPGTVRAEGDWSNIAFWIIAGILSKGDPVRCEGLSMDSLQSDRAVASLAEEMGGLIRHDNSSLTAERNELNAIEINASGIPDLVPVLAVAAATADGTTRIYNAERLRIKESDRLAAMCDCLSRIGADIAEEPGGLIIRGVPALRGGTVSGYNDHRIVMALSTLLCLTGGEIEGAEAVKKSLPEYFDLLKSIGANFTVCNEAGGKNKA